MITQIVKRKEWMFRLVGDEVFDVDKVQCTIKVEPDGLFMYTYDLLVDGKSLEDFCEYFSKTRSTWLITTANGVENRIILGKRISFNYIYYSYIILFIFSALLHILHIYQWRIYSGKNGTPPHLFF